MTEAEPAEDSEPLVGGDPTGLDTTPALAPPSLARRVSELFPPGTVPVAAAVLITGLASYAFLSVASHTLPAHQYDSISVLWALVFLLGPGLFIPVEQEVGRAVADRRARGLGWSPVVQLAGYLAAGFALALTVGAFAAQAPLRDRLFDGHWLVLIGLVLGIDGYATEHLLRGTLAGTGRFTAYGYVFAAESLIRLVLAVGLAIAGVHTAGLFGLAVGVPPLLAVLLVARWQRRGLLAPGPEAHRPELSQNLGWLLGASLFNFGLINCAPVAAKLLSHGHHGNAAGRVLDGLLIARIPLFLFQAVQAALLPNLASLAAEERMDEFRASLRNLALAVFAVAGLGALGCLVLGPFVVGLLFPAKLTLGRIDLTLLALGSGAIMLGICGAQAAIALGGHRDAAVGWVLGFVAFALACLLPGDVVRRITVAFLIGTAVAAGVLCLLFFRRLVRPAAQAN